MVRIKILFVVLILAGAGACRDPWSTSPSAPPHAFAEPGLRVVRVLPPENRIPPEGAALFAGGLPPVRLGPRNDWSTPLDPSHELPLLLEIEALGGPTAFHRFRRAVGTDATWPLEIPLLERVPLEDSSYLELLDLLQEFLRPWSGSRIQRWPDGPLEVALPALAADDPYLLSCEEALAVWNEALGRTRLVAVEPSQEAPIHCTVFDTDEAAFTRAEARDDAGNPLRLRVHLSRRWTEDHPRFIRRIWVHEFGHALGLWGHSRELRHVVNGRAVITDAPHAHEIAALRLLQRLPRGFDLSWVRRRWSVPPEPGPCPVESVDVDLPRQEILHGAVPGTQRGAEPPAQIAPRAPGPRR